MEVKYNKNNVSSHLGWLIKLEFKNKIKETHTLSGVILSTTKEHFIFLVNNSEPELYLRYTQIINISTIKKLPRQSLRQ